MKYPDLFVDLDGVLADYDGDYRRLTGGDPSEKGKVKAARFKGHPHFYRTLPLMNDAMKLWNFLKPYDPHILSAKSNYLPASKQDKIEWVEQHLHLTGKRVIIVDYPNHKYRYCTPGAILIDDNTKNCSEWTNAGGIAIIHHSAEETIHKLKAILNHVDTHHVHEAFEQLKAQEPVCENVIETFDELIDRT